MIKDSTEHWLGPLAIWSSIILFLCRRSSVAVKVNLCVLAVGVWDSAERWFHPLLFFNLWMALFFEQLAKMIVRLPYQAVLLILTASVRLRETTPPTGSSNTCWSYILSDTTLPCQPEFVFAAGSFRTRNLPNTSLCWGRWYCFIRLFIFSDVIIFLVFIPSSQRSMPSHSLGRSRDRGKAMPQDDHSHINEHIKADLIK